MLELLLIALAPPVAAPEPAPPPAAAADACEAHGRTLSRCVLDGLAAAKPTTPATEEELMDLSLDLWESVGEVAATCAERLGATEECLDRLDKNLWRLLLDSTADERLPVRRAAIVAVVADTELLPPDAERRQAVPALALRRLTDETDDTTLALLLEALMRADLPPSVELHRLLLRHAGEGSDWRRLYATEVLLQSTDCPVPEGAAPPKLTGEQLAVLGACVERWKATPTR